MHIFQYMGKIFCVEFQRSQFLPHETAYIIFDHLTIQYISVRKKTLMLKDVWAMFWKTVN